MITSQSGLYQLTHVRLPQQRTNTLASSVTRLEVVYAFLPPKYVPSSVSPTYIHVYLELCEDSYVTCDWPSVKRQTKHVGLIKREHSYGLHFIKLLSKINKYGKSSRINNYGKGSRINKYGKGSRILLDLILKKIIDNRH